AIRSNRQAQKSIQTGLRGGPAISMVNAPGTSAGHGRHNPVTSDTSHPVISISDIHTAIWCNRDARGINLDRCCGQRAIAGEAAKTVSSNRIDDVMNLLRDYLPAIS